MDFEAILQEELSARQEGRNFAVVTIVESEDTARSYGKMLVYPEGTISGTIGGGGAERMAIWDAMACLEKGENAVKHYDLTNEATVQGLACGGKITVFIESCRSNRPQLVMVGGGHVGRSLLRIAGCTGFATTLVDTRGEEDIGEAIRLADRFQRVENFTTDLEKLSLPAGAYYVIATYGHQFDGDALSGALKHEDAAYIGMIGSHRKVAAIFARLENEGVSHAVLERVHTPIGLDLGGETPEEVAVSILAELLMVKNGRNGNQLSTEIK